MKVLRNVKSDVYKEEHKNRQNMKIIGTGIFN